MRSTETIYTRKPAVDGYQLLTVSITKGMKEQLDAIKAHVRAQGMEFNTSAFVRSLISDGCDRLSKQIAGQRDVRKPAA